MSKSFSLAPFLLLCCLGSAQNAELPPHTAVEIRILEDISSQSLHAGQVIAFEVDHDIVRDSTIVIPHGTSVTGEVTQVKAAGRAGREGSLDLVLKPLRLSDGTTLQLDFYRPKKRSGKGEKAAVGIVAPFVLFYYWPLLPVAMIQESRNHGQPYLVKKGERYIVYVIASQTASAGEPATPASKPSPK